MARQAESASAAGQPSRWSQLSPVKRMRNSCATALFTLLTAVYALMGMLYGNLPFFSGDDILMLQGATCLLASLAAAALSVVGVSHLLERYAPPVGGLQKLRSGCYVVVFAGISAAVYAATPGMSRIRAFEASRALRPEAEWLYWPLPWLWSVVSPLSDIHWTSLVYLGVGFTLAVAVLVMRVASSYRAAVAGFATAACVWAAHALGEAAFYYGAARGLAGANPSFAQHLLTQPGNYNAWTALWWWSALTALAIGGLGMFAALFTREDGE